MENEEFMSVAALAKRLGFCTATIYRALNAGQIVGVKMGGSWRIASDEVERILTDGFSTGEIDGGGI